VINGNRRIRVHEIFETLVMRRLGIVEELAAEGGLKINP